MCNISHLWLKPGPYAPPFLHTLRHSQYTLLPNWLVHHFAVSSKKFLHIFLVAKPQQRLSNSATYSFIPFNFSEVTSALFVSVLLAREVQHVTSKKVVAIQASGILVSPSPCLLPAPHMVLALEPCLHGEGCALGGVGEGSLPAVCHSPDTQDKPWPHSGLWAKLLHILYKYFKHFNMLNKPGVSCSLWHSFPGVTSEEVLLLHLELLSPLSLFSWTWWSWVVAGDSSVAEVCLDEVLLLNGRSCFPLKSDCYHKWRAYKTHPVSSGIYCHHWLGDLEILIAYFWEGYPRINKQSPFLGRLWKQLGPEQRGAPDKANCRRTNHPWMRHCRDSSWKKLLWALPPSYCYLLLPVLASQTTTHTNTKINNRFTKPQQRHIKHLWNNLFFASIIPAIADEAWSGSLW